MKRTPLTRTRPLKASTPPKGPGTAPKHGKARTPLKARKRKVSEFVRVYGSKARVAWVAGLPCVGCGHRGTNHNHHTAHPSKGMGRKADAAAIVPLCAACHRFVHDCGERRFAKWKGLDLQAEAARVQAAWEAENDT